jgi:hypothetical protein
MILGAGVLVAIAAVAGRLVAIAAAGVLSASSLAVARVVGPSDGAILGVAGRAAFGGALGLHAASSILAATTNAIICKIGLRLGISAPSHRQTCTPQL